MQLEDKVALVTGGAVRIGRAVCRALAAEGARVVVHYHRSADEARELVAELRREAGAEAQALPADLMHEAACRELVESARERMGGLDIVVNNAAVFNQHRLEEITEDRLLAEFRPNLFAPALLTRYFAALTGQGKVVNLLDRRVAAPDPDCVPYLLTKKALEEFTRTSALALAPNFTVNAVAPGAVLPPPGEGEEYLSKYTGAAPLTHACTAGDVAGAVVFLLKSDALTGQVVYVDSGLHLLGYRGTAK